MFAGKVVIYGLDYTTSSGATKSVLEIVNPVKADEGYYHCEATYGSSPSRTYSGAPAGLYSE